MRPERPELRIQLVRLGSRFLRHGWTRSFNFAFLYGQFFFPKQRLIKAGLYPSHFWVGAPLSRSPVKIPKCSVGSLISAETPQFVLAPSLLEFGAASRQLLPPRLLVAIPQTCICSCRGAPIEKGPSALCAARLVRLVARLQSAWRFGICWS